MSGLGRAAKVHLIGSSGNIANIDSGAALKISDATRHFFPKGKVRLSNVNYTRLDNAPCNMVRIRNPEGNDPVYIGGIDTYSAKVGRDCILYETEMLDFGVTNANELTAIATTNKQDILVQIFSNEDLDIEISDPGPPDLVPPTISSHFPTPSGVTNREVNTEIYAIFSEELLDESINTTNITVSPSISYQVSKDSVNPLKVIVTPAAALAFSTTYTITFGVGLEDLEDNNLAAPFAFNFATKAAPPPPDVTAPTVITSTPANDSITAATDVKPTVSFSEDMLDSSITTTTVKIFEDATSAAVTIASISHSTDGKTITITPSGALKNSTKYRVEITGGASGVKDVAGNALVSTYIFRFTTVAVATSTLYTLAGTSEFSLDDDATEILEICVNNQSGFYNTRPTEYTFETKKVGSATGNIQVIIMDNNNVVQHTFTEVKAASSLTTGYTSVTLKSPNNDKTMVANWKIGLRYTSGTGSAYIRTKYANNTGYQSTNSIMRIRTSSFFGFFYQDYSDSDIGATVKGVSA